MLIWRAVLSHWRDFSHEEWMDPFLGPVPILPGARPPPTSRAFRRASILGLRPPGERQHGPLFSLLRGLTYEAFSSLRNDAALATEGGPPPRAADFYAAAAEALRAVRSALLAALEGERARNLLIERRMRGAGLDMPPIGPVRRWQMVWVDTGVCSESADPTRLIQHVMPEGTDPRRLAVVTGFARLLKAPRPDWAPPPRPPPATLQIYLGYTRVFSRGARLCAWAIVGVDGGDGLYDDPCAPALPPGPHVAFEAGAAHEVGAPFAVLLVTVAQELDRLLSARPPTPVSIRAPPELAAALAGLTSTPAYPQVRRCLDRARARAPLWLSGAAAHSGLPWADRAAAIATLCLPDMVFGSVGPALALRPHAPMPAPDECCVCYGDFSEPLPSAAMDSPALAGRFACQHALCRACDLDLQRRPSAERCPLCRQPRRVWLPARP